MELNLNNVRIMRMDVTPAKAETLLEKNVSNRTPDINHVKFLCNEMTHGRWEPKNGETITFDENGNLIDGQHRLLAIIMSGTVARHILKEGLQRYAIDRAKSLNGGSK